MAFKFWIRVNNSTPRGSGHLMRMKGLAEQLTADGMEVNIDLSKAPDGWLEVVDDYDIRPSNGAIFIPDLPYCWFLRDEIRNLRRGRNECKNVLVSYGGSNPIADYPKALNEADLVIGACGVSALERAWLGIPAIAWRTVADQRDNFLMLSEKAAIIPGLDPAGAWVKAFKENPSLVATMSKNAMDAVPNDSYQAFISEVRKRTP